MTTTPGVHLSRRYLAQCYASLVSRLAICSTVGQVWAVTERLDALDALLDRTQGDAMTADPAPELLAEVESKCAHDIYEPDYCERCEEPATATAMPARRYALVQSDSGGDWYVIEADRRDEWYSTVTDEQLDAGLSWAHPVGGAESQVTFTDPEIFEVPVEDVPA